MKPDKTIELDKAKAERKAGKYIISFKNQTLTLDSPEDLVYLRTITQKMLEAEHEEMLEEKRKRGEKTYREVRGDQVVQEY